MKFLEQFLIRDFSVICLDNFVDNFLGTFIFQDLSIFQHMFGDDPDLLSTLTNLH